MQKIKDKRQLPGEELIQRGLADIEEGKDTIASCLVRIASTRLSRAGLKIASEPDLPVDSELKLYRLLCQEGGDAYSRYNSMLRELVSFENALDRKNRKALKS